MALDVGSQACGPGIGEQKTPCSGPWFLLILGPCPPPHVKSED